MLVATLRGWRLPNMVGREPLNPTIPSSALMTPVAGSASGAGPCATHMSEPTPPVVLICGNLKQPSVAVSPRTCCFPMRAAPAFSHCQSQACRGLDLLLPSAWCDCRFGESAR